MNKIIINLFIILIICKLCTSQIPTAATCTNDPRIVEGGKPCNGSGDSCASGYFCPTNGGVCTQVTKEGDSCNTDLECSPYFCNSNGKCGMAYFAIAGESCQLDSDCAMGTQLKCNTVCTLPENAKCKVASECGVNKNCVNSECVDSSKKGSECSGRYDCPVNLVCTYPDNESTTKQCLDPWTKALGDKCDSSTDQQRIPFFYDCDIGKNLYCGSNGKCVTDKPSNECTQCNSTVSCGGYSESCLCNNHDVPLETENTLKYGICVPQVYINQKCKSVFSDLIQCCAENGCPMNQNLLLNKGSCAFKHCSQYSCQMGECFRPTGTFNMLNLAKESCGTKFALPKDYTATCPSGVIGSNEPNNSNSMLPSIIFSILFIIIMVILS